MNRSMLLFAALALALLLPTAAAAKGPSEASITGGNLTKTIKIVGNGESDQTPLGQLTQEAGFFAAAFGQSPDPMLAHRPKGNLGPRLTIHYVVPGGDNQTFYIEQDVYPYAKGGAHTYMKPGQPIFGMATIGGWYRAYGLKRTLVQLGLPASASRTASSTGSRLALLAGIGIPGALALTGAAVFFKRRKHQGS
jgi:hypothetical protein